MPTRSGRMSTRGPHQVGLADALLPQLAAEYRITFPLRELKKKAPPCKPGGQPSVRVGHVPNLLTSTWLSSSESSLLTIALRVSFLSEPKALDAALLCRPCFPTGLRLPINMVGTGIQYALRYHEVCRHRFFGRRLGGRLLHESSIFQLFGPLRPTLRHAALHVSPNGFTAVPDSFGTRFFGGHGDAGMIVESMEGWDLRRTGAGPGLEKTEG